MPVAPQRTRGGGNPGISFTKCTNRSLRESARVGGETERESLCLEAKAPYITVFYPPSSRPPPLPFRFLFLPRLFRTVLEIATAVITDVTRARQRESDGGLARTLNTTYCLFVLT